MVFLGLGWVILQEFLFKGKSGVALLGSLTDVLLDKVITFALRLIQRDCDVLVEFVLLAHDHVFDRAAHFFYQENVEL